MFWCDKAQRPNFSKKKQYPAEYRNFEKSRFKERAVMLPDRMDGQYQVCLAWVHYIWYVQQLPHHTIFGRVREMDVRGSNISAS